MSLGIFHAEAEIYTEKRFYIIFSVATSLHIFRDKEKCLRAPGASWVSFGAGGVGGGLSSILEYDSYRITSSQIYHKWRP